MKKQGLKVPQGVKEELDELNQIWSRARIFRRFISRPGSLKITVPAPEGMAVVSWKVESGGVLALRNLTTFATYDGSRKGPG
jgi:hypothetical protein